MLANKFKVTKNNKLSERGCNKKYKFYSILILALIFLIAILPAINPVGEASWCCEKTKSGAWCQNAPQDKCDPKYQKIPTSCEATVYCKLGWCYDSKEGTCMPNTPQKVCNDNGGVWNSGKSEPPQCSLGCCVLGDQVAFVTQTGCKALSAQYGLETNFRSDITSDIECLTSITSEVKGACVFERDYQKTCRLLSQKDCIDLGKGSQNEVSFHAGYLCSADELATNCGQTGKTTCVEGKDGIYFVDSCGNLANIYDSKKVNDKDYWTRIKDPTESCGSDSSNANSKYCGNCDYYLGSTCKSYDRTKDKTKPSYGDNICRNLACKDPEFSKKYGRDPAHGETWCETNTNKLNSPGSEYYRLVCYNNDVTIEPCNAFRQEICLQSATNGINSAKCSANLWQDCIAQNNEQDCTNPDQRDCRWIKNGGVWKENNATLGYIKGVDSYVCVANYTSGFDFWNSEGEAAGICKIADAECVAKFEKGLLKGTWKCVDNCECCINDDTHGGCKGDQWVEQKQNVCTSLGDCGDKVSYIGVKGYANRSIATRDGKVVQK